MRNKTVAVIITAIIFVCLLGWVPQFIYNHYLKESSSSDEVSIAWAEAYPFHAEEEESGERPAEDAAPQNTVSHVLETYVNLAKDVESKIETSFNNNFLLRIPIVEMSGRLLKLIGIKQISGSDTVVDLGDGYLTYVKDKRDVSYAAAEINQFSAWLAQRDIDFLYVQTPFKIDENSEELAGYTDYSNENADSFLAALDETVHTYDLREDMQQDFQGQWKEQFFKTDHHWRPETGLWATQKIAEELNAAYHYTIDTSIFNIENYNIETYKSWLLGSLGQKVTLGYTEAEDLDIYYPKADTNLHVTIPSLNMDITGDFYDTLIYQRVLKTRNYYDWQTYWAYGYGDRALIQIDNLAIDKGQKILMIKDSFGDTVYPFLSLGVNEIDVIDTRRFTGSVRTYIEEYDPDTVIFLCNSDSLPDGEIEYEGHTDMFDLR